MKRRNWIRDIIRGMSFTTALFVFQACYGTDQPFGEDLLFEGTVTSKSSGIPIEGIRVSMNSVAAQYTNEQGAYSFYAPTMDQMTMHFRDLDSLDNGFYHDTDTLITDLVHGDDIDRLVLNIELEER
ncbi:MAG: hypothetical protein ABFS10_14105 [Bacteroidota bacterium]